jgi:hypothetical protein
VAHTESKGYYPGRDNYSPNSFSFFSAARRLEDLKAYWLNSKHDVVYHYRLKKDLVLVTLPALESLHDWLQEHTDMVGEVPYNKVKKSFPYEEKGRYAWDYADMGLVCAVFGADGVVRHDEVVICAPFQTIMVIVDVSVQEGGTPNEPSTVDDLQDMGMDIYYKPPPNIVRKMQSYKSVADVRRRIHAARGVQANAEEEERKAARGRGQAHTRWYPMGEHPSAAAPAEPSPPADHDEKTPPFTLHEVNKWCDKPIKGGVDNVYKLAKQVGLDKYGKSKRVLCPKLRGLFLEKGARESTSAPRKTNPSD